VGLVLCIAMSVKNLIRCSIYIPPIKIGMYEYTCLTCRCCWRDARKLEQAPPSLATELLYSLQRIDCVNVYILSINHRHFKQTSHVVRYWTTVIFYFSLQHTKRKCFSHLSVNNMFGTSEHLQKLFIKSFCVKSQNLFQYCIKIYKSKYHIVLVQHIKPNCFFF